MTGCCVYFLFSPKCHHDNNEVFSGGFIKIGMTCSIDSRMSALNGLCNGDSKLIGLIDTESRLSARRLENDYHKKFAQLKFRGEWFYRTNFLKKWLNEKFSTRYIFGGVTTHRNIFYENLDDDGHRNTDDRYERAAIRFQCEEDLERLVSRND